jgi:hypothetical protein
VVGLVLALVRQPHQPVYEVCLVQGDSRMSGQRLQQPQVLAVKRLLLERTVEHQQRCPDVLVQRHRDGEPITVRPDDRGNRRPARSDLGRPQHRGPIQGRHPPRTGEIGGRHRRPGHDPVARHRPAGTIIRRGDDQLGLTGPQQVGRLDQHRLDHPVQVGGVSGRADEPVQQLQPGVPGHE